MQFSVTASSVLGGPWVQSAFYIFTETLLNKHSHNLHQESKNIEPQPVL